MAASAIELPLATYFYSLASTSLLRLHFAIRILQRCTLFLIVDLGLATAIGFDIPPGLMLVGYAAGFALLVLHCWFCTAGLALLVFTPGLAILVLYFRAYVLVLIFLSLLSALSFWP
jgi:hypothetical protein